MTTPVTVIVVPRSTGGASFGERDGIEYSSVGVNAVLTDKCRRFLWVYL
jgi:hypothetical protein